MVGRSPKILCARDHDDEIFATKFLRARSVALCFQNFRISNPPPGKHLFKKFQMMIVLARARKFSKIVIRNICITNLMIFKNFSLSVSINSKKNDLKVGKFCKTGLFSRNFCERAKMFLKNPKFRQFFYSQTQSHTKI